MSWCLSLVVVWERAPFSVAGSISSTTTPLPATIDDYRDADRSAQLAALDAIRGAHIDRQPRGWDPTIVDVTRETRTIDHEHGTIATTWRERLSRWVYAERQADVIPDDADADAWGDSYDPWGDSMSFRPPSRRGGGAPCPLRRASA